MRKPELTVDQILSWADEYFARWKRWPNRKSGRIPRSLGETWCGVNLALRNNGRGLTVCCTLAQLLEERRGVPHRLHLPRLTERLILAWADGHFRRKGDWPNGESGPVLASPRERWSAIDRALRQGHRGLHGGSSLAKLLAAKRGVRRTYNLPPLTYRLILNWADDHHRRTGQWPTDRSGPVLAAPGENWQQVAWALEQGHRGLPPGGSLPQLLARNRGVRNRGHLPPLPVPKIRTWVLNHIKRTGRRPTHLSGPIPGSGGETWGGIEGASRHGWRGLQPGGSLFRIIKPLCPPGMDKPNRTTIRPSGSMVR